MTAHSREERAARRRAVEAALDAGHRKSAAWRRERPRTAAEGPQRTAGGPRKDRRRNATQPLAVSEHANVRGWKTDDGMGVSSQCARELSADTGASCFGSWRVYLVSWASFSVINIKQLING